MPEHDVVIVGAGPVGLLLACLLAQEGLDVLVCEQRTGTQERTRAIGIHPPGVRALEAAGIGDRMRAEALALDGGEVLRGGRILASVDFRDGRRVLILPQHRTDALLRERLEELQPRGLQDGCRVLAVRDEETGVRLSVERDGVPHEITAAFAVIADGVHSALRDSLGIVWRQRRGKASYVMVDVADAAAGTRARLYCESAGLVESFPLPQGRRRWVVLDTQPQRGTLHTAQGMRAEIEARTGTMPEIPDDAQPTAFLAAQHLASSTVMGRVILLGDAAHEISPIGGQGMNLGWMGAQRAAAAITRSFREGRVELRGLDRPALRSARVAQRRSRFYMAMGHPATGVALEARTALIRTLGLAPVRGHTAGLLTMRGF